MFGNETMKFDLNIRKKICGFLLNSLNSKSQEENEGGLEVIGNLLQKQQVYLFIFIYLKFFNHRVLTF